MNAEMPVSALADFGKLINIPTLAFDPFGYCCLLIDEITVNLEYDPSNGNLLVYAHLGLLPEPASTAFCEMLLEANFFCRDTNNATLGIDRASRAIVLYLSHPSTSLDSAALEAVISRFTNTAESWKRRIAAQPVLATPETCLPTAFADQLNATRI